MKNQFLFALKNILSGTDRKNHDELPTLVGVMTHEAHSSALPWVGSSLWGGNDEGAESEEEMSEYGQQGF